MEIAVVEEYSSESRKRKSQSTERQRKRNSGIPNLIGL